MDFLEIAEQIATESKGLDFEALDSLESKTQQWLQKRRGRFTASEFHRLMGYRSKPDFPKGAETYAMEKAVEALTTESDYFSNAAMEHGNAHEVEAVEYFMEVTGLTVEKYGNDQEFVELGDDVGCTPDGRIGINGGYEGKAPNSKTHFFYLTNVKNAADLEKHCSNYFWQVVGSMYVTGADFWYWVSYDPRFKKPEHRMHIVKIERDEKAIEDLKRRLRQGIRYRNDKIKELDAIA